MTPILDPRRSEQLLADLLRRRAGYVPTFAPAPGGPGSALLQITAGEIAALVERLDQAPDKLGLALLDLVGVGLVPAQPARAPVVFSATPGVGDATAPAGSRLGARVPGREDPLVFETESTIAIAGARLVEVTSVDPGRDAYAAHAADLGTGREVTLFAQPTPFAHELYLGHATAFAFAGRVTVEIDLTLQLGASQHLPLAADWFDGTAWQPFASFAEPAGDEDSHDGTDGLRHGGVVRLTTACAHSKPTTVRGVTTHWVRLAVTAPLSPAMPATLPIVERLDVRSIIEHRRVIQSVTESPTGTVVGVWTPLGDPIADGQEVTVKDLVSDATQVVTTAAGAATPALAAGETYAFALGDPVDPDDYGTPVTMPAAPQRIDLAEHAGLPLDKGVCDGKTLDLTKSFQPLGPTPDAGAALYLACADVFSKAGAEVTLVLDRPKTVQEEAGEQGHMYEIEINAARDLVHHIEKELNDIATALDAANAALAAPLPLLIKTGDSTDHWYGALTTALKSTLDVLGNATGGPFGLLLKVIGDAANAILSGNDLTSALKNSVKGARDLAAALRELGATTPGLDPAIHDANVALTGNDVGALTGALLGLSTELVNVAAGGVAFLGALPSFLAMKPEDYVAAVAARIAAAVTAFTTAAAAIRAVVAELQAFNPAALVAAAGGPAPNLNPPTMVWEFWNGDRWLGVPMLAGTSAAAASFSGPGKVRFRVPDGWVPSAVAGDDRLWLRARLASGRFARLRLVAWTDANSNLVNFLPVIEPRPPTLGGIDVYYRFASPTGPPEAALAANDAGWRDLSGSLHWPGPSFAPYLPCSDPAPTLYLGFDAPLPAERIGVFLGIPDQPDAQPTDFRCEAFDGAVFRPVVVEDGTRGLTMAGVVHLVWPGDDGGFASLVVQAGGTTVRLAEAGAGLRYAPGATLWLADAAGGELVDVAAVDDRVLTLQRPVSRTYSGAAVRAAPPARFGTPRAWLRLVFDADAEPPPVVLTAVLANAVSAANTLTVTDEVLGGADGSPGQVLFLRNAPVLAGATIQVRELEGPRAAVDAPILKDELTAQRRPGDFVPTVDPVTGVVTEVWVTWQVRDTLAFSGPDDRDCTIDSVGGRVLFGDGTFGRIPPAGRDNVRAAYRAAGNGPDGNVPAGAIASVLSGVLAQGVTNPLPALGGAGSETLPRLARRGPDVLRHRHQSLTAADYEALAYDASAAVARARALGATDASRRSVPGLVRLVIVPGGREPAPQPTGELRRQVADLIRARMPLTIGRGLTVVGPAYTTVGVDVTVRASRPEQAGTLREAVRDAITRFLHPVSGGPGGDGFAFGARVASSDLARELATLPDLDALIELAFVVDDIPAGEQFTLAGDRLPTAGRIRVNVSELA